MPVHPYIHVLKANLLGSETSCSTNDLVFFILVCLFSLFICSKIHTFTSLAGPVFANHTVELSQLHLLVNVLSRNSDTIWHWHNSIQSNRRSFPLTAFPLYTTYYSMFVFLLSTCLVIDKYIYIHFFFVKKELCYMWFYIFIGIYPFVIHMHEVTVITLLLMMLTYEIMHWDITCLVQKLSSPNADYQNLPQWIVKNHSFFAARDRQAKGFARHWG